MKAEVSNKVTTHKSQSQREFNFAYWSFTITTCVCFDVLRKTIFKKSIVLKPLSFTQLISSAVPWNNEARPTELATIGKQNRLSWAFLDLTPDTLQSFNELGNSFGRTTTNWFKKTKKLNSMKSYRVNTPNSSEVSRWILTSFEAVLSCYRSLYINKRFQSVSLSTTVTWEIISNKSFNISNLVPEKHRPLNIMSQSWCF